MTTLLNRNEVMQGASPEALAVLKNFDPKHASFYLDGYFGSILIPKLSSLFNLPKEQVMVGYGVESLLRTILDGLKSEETVLIPELSYSFYSKYLDFKGVKYTTFKLNEKETTFEFDVEDCVSKIKETNPKVVLITSPNNPTGNSIKSDSMATIIDATDKNSFVILDEAYFGFDGDYDESFLSLLKQHDNLLILRSFSKLYALAGMRIGFGLCGKKVKEILRYEDLYLGGSRVLEEIAVSALESKDYYKNLSKEIIADRTNFIESVNKLNHFKAYDSKSNFVLVKVSPEAKEVLESKLSSEEVIISKFVKDNYMRVTVGYSPNTTRFLEILSEIDKTV